MVVRAAIDEAPQGRGGAQRTVDVAAA